MSDLEAQQPIRAGVKPAPTTARSTLLVGAGFIPARKEPIVPLSPALKSLNLGNNFKFPRE